ncbi:UNVERIFIED_CONTAM: hypothetical protein GTU68_030573, partial [Idotea baltica]|nr:hypothetical protein [Idotea baltica]
MKSVIISDLHLSPSRPAITRAFNQFVESFPEDVGELYILGDLFEVWLGDDDNSAFAQAIVESIRRLSKSGVRTYFQRGNRDFLVGQRFSNNTSCKILPDFSVHDIRGHKILLTHGDLLCTDDHAYQKFRRRIQHPITKWVLTRLPMSSRRKLAVKVRSVSTEEAANKPENIMDVNQDAVEKCLKHYDVTTMVHGHTHRPAVHDLNL